MAIKLNPGRQYGLTLIQNFSFADLDGVKPVVAAKLPRDAIILRGYISVTKAFSAGTLSVGTADTADAYGALDTSTTGVKALTANGKSSDKVELLLTPSAAMTKGAGQLLVEYVVPHRANEAQP